jgi:hypothetical protein
MPTLSHNTSIRGFPVHGLKGLDSSDSDSDSDAGAADDGSSNSKRRPPPAQRGTLAAAASEGRPDATQAVSQFLDTDTRISRESFEVARLAAGAVIQAVDMVAAGAYTRVFVASRPPGHHAGPRGAVPAHSFWKAPSMCSSGFCLINNVAVGAAYARQVYGRPPAGRFQRVAIVDMDIHHGASFPCVCSFVCFSSMHRCSGAKRDPPTLLTHHLRSTATIRERHRGDRPRAQALQARTAPARVVGARRVRNVPAVAERGRRRQRLFRVSCAFFVFG